MDVKGVGAVAVEDVSLLCVAGAGTASKVGLGAGTDMGLLIGCIRTREIWGPGPEGPSEADGHWWVVFDTHLLWK